MCMSVRVSECVWVGVCECAHVWVCMSVRVWVYAGRTLPVPLLKTFDAYSFCQACAISI